MSPKPFTENSQREYSRDHDLEWCQDCQRFYWRDHEGHRCEPQPVGALYTLRHALAFILTAAAILGVLAYATNAHAREGAIHPVPAPQSLLKARAACPNGASPVKCRAALRRAYEAVTWQREQNLDLAREMVGNVTNWRCIHSKEAAWDDTGDPYWGGLQMDRTFMRSYGKDMIRRHHAWANTWTPREQIIVAQRAFVQGRGYAPWPNTSRACGLR